MGATKMSFDGETYYGVAGSTAATLISNIRDVNFNIDTTTAKTTVKGTGQPAIETEQVTVVVLSMDFLMLDKSDDTTLTALRTAVATGGPVAIRMKDYSAGKGFDGDVTLTVKRGAPYEGEQTFAFTAKPTDESGRAPQPYT